MNNAFTDQNPLAVERQHAVTVIGSLYQFYDSCPVFFIGNIQDALNAAFGSTVIKKRCPLLIYIHHNSKMPDLFSSEIFIEFLGENFIVWPWDITNESNRQILIKIWKEYFPEESSFIDFSIDECPMLIGITRQPSIKNGPFSEPSYEFEVLLRDDVLVRTHVQLDVEILLYQLIAFREEFITYGQYFLCDFVEKTGFNPELILELAEYLSLNDAITMFSLGILPLLKKYSRKKFSIIDPCDKFMTKIIQKIDLEQIELRLEASRIQRTIELASPHIFTNVTSLRIIHFQELKQLLEIENYFLNITFLSFHCDGEVDFHKLCKIFNYIPDSVKQLDIYCDSIRCSHDCLKILYAEVNEFNKTIESFGLHVNVTSRSLINKCYQAFGKCILRTITDFIKIMLNIRCVCLITKKGNIEAFLDVEEWNVLLNICKQLKKINLKGKKNMSKDIQLMYGIQEIKDELHNIRESIQFDAQVK